MITLNVGLLLQVLSLLIFLPLAYGLIFRPVQRVLEARDALSEAARAEAELAARRAAELENQRQAALEAARQQGEGQGRRRLEEQRRAAETALARAEKSGEDLYQAARAELERELAGARREARAGVDELAARLARRLVEEEPT